MLIRFVISNYLSFKDETEFYMLADNFRGHAHHIYKTKSLKILKSSAIYGANGAGKSNLIKSIDFIKKLVANGRLDKSVNSKKFKLHTDYINKPVNFEIEFFYKNKIYNYGLQLNDKIIENEWLYISGIEKDDKLIFDRKTVSNGKSKIKFNDKIFKTKKDKLLIQLYEENLLKNDQLFLSKSPEIDKTDFKNAYEWITQKLIIIFPRSRYIGLVSFLLSSDEFKQFTNETLNAFQTGVKELDIQKISFDDFFGIEDNNLKEELKADLNNNKQKFLLANTNEDILAVNENGNFFIKKVATLHYNNVNNKILFEISEESDGTRRLLDIIPALYNILRKDITIVIDEIDQSIHPVLLYNLIKKIMNAENTKGQLIFTTHEANLLDLTIFRQDEIWFAEKNKSNSTELYSLGDFRPRNDLDIKKGYLKGRFGAIPFIADLKKLKWTENEEEKRI